MPLVQGLAKRACELGTRKNYKRQANLGERVGRNKSEYEAFEDPKNEFNKGKCRRCRRVEEVDAAGEIHRDLSKSNALKSRDEGLSSSGKQGLLHRLAQAVPSFKLGKDLALRPTGFYLSTYLVSPYAMLKSPSFNPYKCTPTSSEARSRNNQ
jgi:hypothetical protein